MAQIKITADLAGLKRLQKLLNEKVSLTKSDAKELGEIVLDKMRKMIVSGNSPITGNAFPSYRGSYKKRIESTGEAVGSDGGIHDKELEPVNLIVSGGFINSIKVLRTEKIGNNYLPVIGIKGNKYIPIEEGHREGANGQKKRPVIPEESEGFAPAINREIIEFLQKKIAEIDLE